MKTTAQIEEMAKNYAKSCDNESGGFLAHQLIEIRKKAYINGRLDERKDLLESASEGFEEWHVETWGISPDEIQIEGLADLKKRIWQASRLGMEKENEQLKEDNLYLGSINAKLEEARVAHLEDSEKLQNEIKQLKEDLDWIIAMTTFGQKKYEKCTASEYYEKAQEIRQRHGLDKEKKL